MFHWQWRRDVTKRLDALLDGQTKILATLNVVKKQEESIMPTLDDLTADVQSQGTVIQSAEALLSGLSQQLKDALAANDPAKVQGIIDAIDAQKSDLAAAVAANTPGSDGGDAGTGTDTGTGG